MKKMLLSIGLVIGFVSLSLAEVPNLIQYQGRLTTVVGEPLSGTHALTATIYDAVEDGQALWTETHSNVVIEQGLFSIFLGSLVAIPDQLFTAPDRFLEIQIDGEALTPRTQLTAVGYSKSVGTIDGASGGVITDSLVIIPSSALINGRAPSDISAITTKIVFGFSGSGLPTMGFYEPVDTKSGGTVGDGKAIQIDGNSIVMFGSNGEDTVLIVYPNGDITSKGQITMGENSSPGVKTTVLGFQNTAAGDTSTIGGGSGNITNGVISVIAGGHANQADGEGSVVGGGAQNLATGNYATISGGKDNAAAGDYGTVPGGQNNNADGQYSYAAGRRAKSEHQGSFVWADHTDADFSSTKDDQFLIRAQGGVEIVGPDHDSSVALPGNAISAPEILDEPGVAAEWSTQDIVLTQKATLMEPLVTMTIDVPAPGYVVVRGSATFEFTGTSQRNQAYVQISPAPGGGSLSPYSRSAGTGDNPSQNRLNYFDITSERIFYVTAGQHSFVFEGLAHPLNGSSAISTVQHPQMSAMFVPTSYGSVTGFVTSQSVGEFRQRLVADWFDASDSLGTVVTDEFYKVDLRELEQKVQQARRQLEQAEAELRSARVMQTSGQ